MSNHKSFRALLNTRKTSMDIFKRVATKKRKQRDTKFGSRKGEGGLSQSFGYGLNFDGGDGGESHKLLDNQMISEAPMRSKRRGRLRRQREQYKQNDNFTFGTISPKAQMHDQGNSGHLDYDPRPLPDEKKIRRDLENQEEPLLSRDELEDSEQSRDETNSNTQIHRPDDTSLEPRDGDEDNDPNRMGLIRRVKNAHLVYKRQTESGTYEELWIYNINDNLHDEIQIRRAILAGTDIPAEKMSTEDNQQMYDLWTSGNAQLILISGLPN